MFIRAHVYMQRSEVNSQASFFSNCLSCFCDKATHWDLQLTLIWLWWLVSQPQIQTCLCFPEAGITNTWHYAQFFTLVMWFKHRSLCFHGRASSTEASPQPRNALSNFQLVIKKLFSSCSKCSPIHIIVKEYDTDSFELLKLGLKPNFLWAWKEHILFNYVMPYVYL